jgi:hypothetical protein
MDRLYMREALILTPLILTHLLDIALGLLETHASGFGLN